MASFVAKGWRSRPAAVFGSKIWSDIKSRNGRWTACLAFRSEIPLLLWYSEFSTQVTGVLRSELPANQRRTRSPWWPITITKRSIPACFAPDMTCSSRGTPSNRTSGLGRKPETLFSRLPRPAARMTATLVLSMICLNPVHHRLSRQGRLSSRIRLIIEVANRDLGFSENACVGHAFCRDGEPKGAGFVILLHEMNAMRPKRRIFCWFALDSNDRKILGIDPDAALEQVFILALRDNLDDVSRPSVQGIVAEHLESIILGSKAGGPTNLRLGSFRFGFEHLANNALVRGFPTLFGNNFEILGSVGIALDAHQHFGALVHAMVFQNIASAAGVAAPQLISLAVMIDQLRDDFIRVENGSFLRTTDCCWSQGQE